MNVSLFNRFIFFYLKRLDGGTPVHLACRLGAPEILQCLYEHDPAAFQHALVDKEFMTPLHRLGLVTLAIRSCKKMKIVKSKEKALALENLPQC